jgi:hypothetical protein
VGSRIRTRTLVTETHRLSVYQGIAWGELYDLVGDPLELHNLWDEPAASGLKGALTERMAREMIALYDTLPRPTRFA